MLEREIRDLATVPRWVTARVIHRQNIAEHSCMVAIYADQIAGWLGWDGDYGKLLRWALWHDAEETISGDMPGPTKRQVVDRKAFNAYMNAKMSQRFPEMEWIEPADDIKVIVKVADLLDELFYMLTEKQMGNGALETLISNTTRNLSEAVDKMPVNDQMKSILWGHILKAVDDHANKQSKVMLG